ncbi:MAG: PAS domain-containing sensor histidine kinase [Bacteroidia bacterium]|nr:PAS domain-containing sensor histidine kinase [Bacteroidia bacterium]
MRDDWREQRNQIIGLGENSFKKSYYPELQEKLSELETSYKNLKSIFDNVEDGIVLHDENGFVYFHNRQMSGIINTGEDLGRESDINVSELFPDEQDKIKMLGIWKEVMGGMPKVISTILTPIGSDSKIHVQVSMNKTVWYGRPLIVAVIRDFTERAKFENQLVKAKEKAEEGERLMTAFLQNISHEIRTPLNAIMGFSGLLDESELEPDRRKDFISIILRSSNQLLHVVNDILTISSIETRHIKLRENKTNLNELIDNLFATFKAEADLKGLELRHQKGFADDNAEVYTDLLKLHQIISNLISNALKYTHRGSVTFGYDLKSGEKGEFLSFFVKDTGIGIEKERQQIIFEKFRKIDDKSGTLNGGMGLGLSIAKAFADIMGGRIKVESVAGEGSVFYLEIPYKPIY